MNILTIDNLRKSYGPLLALNNVSFEVPQGSIFGILGPNGSGKTTLLGILLNIVLPNGGSYKFASDEPANEFRKKVGTLLETPNFYHYLDAVDNLAIVAAIKNKGKERIAEVLKTVNLWDRRHIKFKGYSLGMRQRLAIASALLSDPEMLILDEPTNGLDPQGIHEIRTLIKELNRQGKTILMASHLLDEVEKTCTHVAVMRKGKLLETGTVDSILGDHAAIEISAADLHQLEALLINYPGVQSIERNNDHLKLLFEQNGIATESINQYCFENGITLSYLKKAKQSLEAKFLAMTQN